MGWISKNQVVKEFGDAAFSLTKKRSISGVVKSQFGYHIIKYHKSKTQPQQSYEASKVRIQQALYTQKRKALFTELLASSKDEIKVVLDQEN